MPKPEHAEMQERSAMVEVAPEHLVTVLRIVEKMAEGTADSGGIEFAIEALRHWSRQGGMLDE